MTKRSRDYFRVKRIRKNLDRAAVLARELEASPVGKRYLERLMSHFGMVCTKS